MSQQDSPLDGGYIDVAERIQDFMDTHPNGSLQTISWEIVTIEAVRTRDKKVGGRVIAKAGDPVKATFIVYRAAAYREDMDPRPGHGIAWEPFPGTTPYTADSELMNAETAAWGRAICALGLVSNRSLASRQEVRNRRADQEAEAEAPAPEPEPEPDTLTATIDDSVVKQLQATFKASGKTDDEFCWMLLSVGAVLPENPKPRDIGQAVRGLNLEQAMKVEALLTGEDDAVPGSGEAA